MLWAKNSKQQVRWNTTSCVGLAAGGMRITSGKWIGIKTLLNLGAGMAMGLSHYGIGRKWHWKRHPRSSLRLGLHISCHPLAAKKSATCFAVTRLIVKITGKAADTCSSAKNVHSKALKEWHALLRFSQFYLHTHAFIRQRYRPCLCLPGRSWSSFYRPRRDGRLSGLSWLITYPYPPALINFVDQTNYANHYTTQSPLPVGKDIAKELYCNNSDLMRALVTSSSCYGALEIVGLLLLFFNNIFYNVTQCAFCGLHAQAPLNPYAGDTHTRKLCKELVQVSCTRNLHKIVDASFLYKLTCTRFCTIFLYVSPA